MARRTLYVPVMIAAALAMACSVALLAISQKSEASFPGKNGRIAFEGYRDTGTGDSFVEIISVSPDGTGMKQLTSASGSGNPTFSPNGEKIVYAADYGAGARGPTWSPDGTKIAFVDGPDIWTVKPDGSGRHNLTNTPNSYEEDPDFSPDGKKIAFASKGQYKKPDIYTMQLDGSALTNVTDSRYVGEEDCAWSPSGTTIAYRKDLPENPEIFKKNADGSGRSKNVSNDPKYNSSPDWGTKPTTATG
jgi:Tol biopolymer transport system component